METYWGNKGIGRILNQNDADESTFSEVSTWYYSYLTFTMNSKVD
jgi:hypothetical protein